MPCALTLDAFLIFRAMGRLCAIPTVHVLETMRPLPIQSLESAPRFVAGLSIIRGMPYPVVDLRRFFSPDVTAVPKRLIAIRVGDERRVGLLVDEVLGLCPAQALALEPLPPILKSVETEVVESIALLDGELLEVLKNGFLVPDELWATAPFSGGPS